MAVSRHQIEAEALAKRLRRQSAAGGKRLAKIKAPRISSKRPGGRVSKNAGLWISQGKSPPSILKIHKGGRAGDDYAQKAKGSEFLDSNMLGRNSKERELEWDLDQARHPNIKNLFCHASISLAGGKKLNRDEWTKFIKNWLKEIDAEGVNYVAIRHTNSDHDHTHIIFSRALPNGKLLSTAHNFYKWREALRHAEETNGLKPIEIEQPKEKMTSQSDTQVNAARRAARRGTTPNFINPDVVNSCLLKSVDMDSFTAELKRSGIELKVSRRDNGEARGILFRKANSEEFLAGSSINRELTLPKIHAALKANQELNQRRAFVHTQQIQQQRNSELARARGNRPTQPPREYGF